MDGPYEISLNQYKLIGIYWVANHANNYVETFFDIFRVELISKEFKKSIGNTIINANIYRIQQYVSIMCWHFCIVCINSTLNNKFTNL